MNVSSIQGSMGSNLAILFQNMQVSGIDKTQTGKTTETKPPHPPPPPPPQGGQSLEATILQIGDTDGDGKISEAEREALEEKFGVIMAAIESNMGTSESTSDSTEADTAVDGEASISSILASLGSTESGETSDQSSASLLAVIFSNGQISSKENLMDLLLQSNVDFYA